MGGALENCPFPARRVARVSLGHFFVCPARAVKFNETKTKKPFVES